MLDGFGRRIDYLRLSVTDRCNLRCKYCMPKEGIKRISHDEILTFDEILRICRCMAKLGICKIKITGGEPLIRKGVTQLVKEIKGLPGIDTVTLTTNGVLLAEMIEELERAGLDAINVSLDTQNRELYQYITRRDELFRVQQGVREAAKYTRIRLKINCVPLGLPEQDLLEVAALAEKEPLHVRFIEMMPMGYGKQYQYMSEESILKLIRQRYGRVEPYEKSLGNGPGHYYTVENLCGKIGFISAMSHNFCAECNRVRLTAQGFLKACLQYEKGRDLKSLLRSNCSEELLTQAVIETINQKPSGHEFMSEHIALEDKLCMAQIGG